MKKRIVLLVVFLMVLGGCSQKTTNSKLKVTASFYPLAYFAQRIGGDYVEVTNIMNQGANAHTFEPSVANRLEIEESDLFIYNGIGLESWTEKLVESIKSDVVVLEASKNVPVITNEHEDDEHDHDHEHEDHDHDHEDHDHEREDHDHHHAIDPHVWLNPSTAKVQAQNIYDALVALDEKNKSVYTDNYNKLLNDFVDLDGLIKETVKNAPNKRIVLDHQLFSYMARDYAFTQMSISGYIPESEPTVSQITAVLEFIEKEQVKTVLFSVMSGDKLSNMIGNEANIKIMSINPMETVTDDADYFEIMKENIAAIEAAMK